MCKIVLFSNNFLWHKQEKTQRSYGKTPHPRYEEFPTLGIAMAWLQLKKGGQICSELYMQTKKEIVGNDTLFIS